MWLVFKEGEGECVRSKKVWVEEECKREGRRDEAGGYGRPGRGDHYVITDYPCWRSPGEVETGATLKGSCLTMLPVATGDRDECNTMW